jgi:hypothetical protein
MKNSRTFYGLLLMIGLLFGLVSCTKEIRLNTQGAQDAEVSGNYTAIYYGCNFLNDLETIAILEKEGGRYHFEPYAPDFKYRVKKGLSSEEAIETAKKSVNCNALFKRTQVNRILGPDGETLGYEVRPLYLPYRYGSDDVLDVDYMLKDNKVVIMVRLRASMELLFQDNKGRLSDGDRDRDRGRGKEK